MNREPCPICKKQPPPDMEWKNYPAHVSACARAYYDREKEKLDVEADVMDKFLGILKDLSDAVGEQ